MKYKVISLHFTTDCNLSCPMCYRPKESNGKGCKFFFDLIPYLSELTPQVALGGGEPFLYPQFIRKFSRECKEHGLICNVTTNGTLPAGDFLKDVEMVSVSYDRHKIKSRNDDLRFTNFCKNLKNYTRVGCNLLIDSEMARRLSNLLSVCSHLFTVADVERIFTLYPKNWEFVDILKNKAIYHALTKMYRHFYVDDLTSMIITEGKYSNWKQPCHYGRDIVSIDETGKVTGCSFSKTPLLKVKKPEDILNIKEIKFTERYSCPYLSLR